MRKYDDLTGRIFDRLTVLRLDDQYDPRFGRKWICQCECGKEVSVYAQALKSGNTRSCGCLNHDKSAALKIRRQEHDLTGRTFGVLTVVKLDEEKTRERLGSNDGRYWVCRCECGNLISVSRRSLRMNHWLSCRCPKPKPGVLIDLTGRTFERLTVIGLDESKRGNQGQRYWLCKCACERGTVVSVSGQNLRRGITKSCGCLKAEVWDELNNRPKNKKVCVICGALFDCPPSTRKLTCSEECRTAQRSIAQQARCDYTVSSKKTSALKKGKQDPWLDGGKKGAAAAQASPFAGPYETNVNAIDWILVSPDGVRYEIRNLNLFCREHAAEAGVTPEQMRAGLGQVKRSLMGKRKDSVPSYKGWRLVLTDRDLEQLPDAPSEE